MRNIKGWLITAGVGATIGGIVAMAGCTQQQVQTALATPAGQLFCAVNTIGGGTIIAAITTDIAAGVNPLLQTVSVIATNATKAYVTNACAAAGGLPVSPPPVPSAAPQINVPSSALISTNFVPLSTPGPVLNAPAIPSTASVAVKG